MSQSENKFSVPFTDDPTYIPFFFTNADDLFDGNQTMKAAAMAICGSTVEDMKTTCLYDYKVTADAAAAASGVAAQGAFDAAKEALGMLF